MAATELEKAEYAVRAQEILVRRDTETIEMLLELYDLAHRLAEESTEQTMDAGELVAWINRLLLETRMARLLAMGNQAIKKGGWQR